MTLSQYLGRGQLSRGRATIKPDLSMSVSTNPWTSNKDDITAVITGVQNLVNALSTVQNMTILEPPNGTDVADWVNAVSLSPNLPYRVSASNYRSRNHTIQERVAQTTGWAPRRSVLTMVVKVEPPS